MASKFYAVKQGKKTGIFNTWAECKAQVMGYSGAIYKSFPTKREAEYYLTGFEEAKEDSAESEVVAYVDGSYDVKTGAFSYGALIFYQGETYEFAEKYAGDELASMRNVAGELKGAEKAMQFSLDHQAASLTIYHDYLGIAYWCTGAWQAKKPGTQAYQRFYTKVRESVDVTFVKVKGHSGDYYNDLVDLLAKKALQ